MLLVCSFLSPLTGSIVVHQHDERGCAFGTGIFRRLEEMGSESFLENRGNDLSRFGNAVQRAADYRGDFKAGTAETSI